LSKRDPKFRVHEWLNYNNLLITYNLNFFSVIKIGFKDLAIKKRDEMLNNYVEENTKLKENIKKLEKLLERVKYQVIIFLNIYYLIILTD
jgi:hypothetical protein